MSNYDDGYEDAKEMMEVRADGVDQLLDEIERLRALLAELLDRCGCGNCIEDCMDIRRRARAVVEQPADKPSVMNIDSDVAD